MIKKIGIDLDNTIINYENSFRVFLKKYKVKKKGINKIQIKKFNFKKINIKNWTQAQEEIYGNYIGYAKKFLFYNLFEKFALNKGFKLYIISHKTKYSQFSKKYNLHKSSKKWIKKNINFKEYKIFFLNTMSKKIAKIKKINPDYYIDDLAKILKDKRMPKNTIKIHFSQKNQKNLINLKTWKEIKRFISKNENIK